MLKEGFSMQINKTKIAIVLALIVVGAIIYISEAFIGQMIAGK